MKKLALAALCAGAAASAVAQTTLTTEFPPEATAPSADALRERLSGKVFRTRVADGNTQRLQFNANGYFFLNTGRGGAADGTWRTEDGRFCLDLKQINAGCSEVRAKGDSLYYKRISNGEVVEMTPG